MSKNFGNNVKMYRLYRKMTQVDLAQALGLSRSAINNYEAGVSEPNFEILCSLGRVLGTSIEDLIIDHEGKYDFGMHEERILDPREDFLLMLFRKSAPTYQSIVLDILRKHVDESES